ncbi:unnamed protein product [Acanthoscelides obtectus]|uniref:Uncharacterized protein n=1 Tax=Acanthoscelides obtectus TaxID=200917 RepID=A0A9P0LV27_ACAOB|nr:unnamed protein product [Acanthoscelides obtectus]CAK1650155.1 hypothetical protein AOBTE_LOCUS16644 [Acanthoscelides obtectus]
MPEQMLEKVPHFFVCPLLFLASSRDANMITLHCSRICSQRIYCDDNISNFLQVITNRVHVLQHGRI